MGHDTPVGDLCWDRDGEGEGELQHSSNALEGGGEDTILGTNTEGYSISF